MWGICKTHYFAMNGQYILSMQTKMKLIKCPPGYSMQSPYGGGGEKCSCHLESVILYRIRCPH